MAIYGTYFCEECNRQFKSWRESEGPYPDCPTCGQEGGWAAMSPAIIGNKAKAIDIAQKVAEETFGMTDMKDNLRPGDTVVKPPPPIQTAEADQISRELVQAGMVEAQTPEHLKGYVQNFFGAGSAAQPSPVAPTSLPMQAGISAPAAAAARADGRDPISMLHAGTKGEMSGRGVGIDKIVPINRPKRN
jgi:hypothetical protein